MEIRRTYMMVGGRIPCMVYEPRICAEKAAVSVILMHSDQNYIEFPPALELSSRGFRVFAAAFPNSRVPLWQKLQQLSQIVELAAGWNGTEKIVLLGHSGGATLMTAYQAVAEKGIAVFQGPEKIIKLPDIGPFRPADGLMLIDANYGNGAMSLLSLDPSIVDESDPAKRDPSLDVMDPANGIAGAEEPHPSDEFLKRFWEGQRLRMDRLIKHAQDRISLIEQGRGLYTDDEPFIIPGGNQTKPCNKIFPQLDRLLSRTRGEWPLIHGDGSITVQTVPCVRSRDMLIDASSRCGTGVLNTTVRMFLDSSAVRALPGLCVDENGVRNVDWDSSYCTGMGNIAHISCPMLLMGLTAGYEYITAEQLMDRAVNAKDKTLAFAEGIGHNFTADPKWGNTLGACFDYVSEWLLQKQLS